MSDDDPFLSEPQLLEVTFPAGYQVIRELGRGSFGKVLLVSSERRNHVVKVFPDRVCESAISEIFVTKHIQPMCKTHMVCYEKYAHHGTMTALVTEYIDGAVSLDQYKGELNINDKISIMTQLLEGLQLMYTIGIVHRDIKPSNIIIEKTNTVRYIDYGVAGIRGDVAEDLTIINNCECSHTNGTRLKMHSWGTRIYVRSLPLGAPMNEFTS